MFYDYLSDSGCQLAAQAGSHSGSFMKPQVVAGIIESWSLTGLEPQMSEDWGCLGIWVLWLSSHMVCTVWQLQGGWAFVWRADASEAHVPGRTVLGRHVPALKSRTIASTTSHPAGSPKSASRFRKEKEFPCHDRAGNTVVANFCKLPSKSTLQTKQFTSLPHTS